MKNLKRAILVVVILVAAFLYAHIGKNHLVYDKHVDNSKYLPTGAAAKIEQTFVCRENTLDGFRTKCQVIGDVRGMKVSYSLTDMETGKVKAKGTANAEKISNSKFYYFRFDTVKNTKGKTYKIVFENQGPDETKGIGFFFQPKTQKDTSLHIKGIDTTGTLIIKAVTQRFDFETFVVLLVFILYVALFIKFLYKLFK